MSLRLIRSEAWLTSEATAGVSGLQLGQESTILCNRTSEPLKNGLDELKASVVTLLGHSLIFCWIGGDDVCDEAVDGIGNAIGRHDRSRLSDEVSSVGQQ